MWVRVCESVWGWATACVCWLRLRAAVLFMKRSQQATLKHGAEPLSWTAAIAVSELSTRCARRLIWQHRASPNPSLYRNLFTLHSKRISTNTYTRTNAGNGQEISEDAFLCAFCFVDFSKKSLYVLGVNPFARGTAERYYICNWYYYFSVVNITCYIPFSNTLWWQLLQISVICHCL